ncbi:LOW QUALITY PROTEIN: hypothetical protein YC2023_012137 [Brassica napus]
MSFNLVVLKIFQGKKFEIVFFFAGKTCWFCEILNKRSVKRKLDWVIYRETQETELVSGRRGLLTRDFQTGDVTGTLPGASTEGPAVAHNSESPSKNGNTHPLDLVTCPKCGGCYGKGSDQLRIFKKLQIEGSALSKESQ